MFMYRLHWVDAVDAGEAADAVNINPGDVIHSMQEGKTPSPARPRPRPGRQGGLGVRRAAES